MLRYANADADAKLTIDWYMICAIYELRRCLHFSWAMWPFLAVVRVNSAPQLGQTDFVAAPDFSRWCRKRLLKVENWRPLQPCSQHCGLGRLCTTLTWSAESDDPIFGLEYIPCIFCMFCIMPDGSEAEERECGLPLWSISEDHHKI